MAAIAGTHANTDMARGGAGCAICRKAGECDDKNEGPLHRRQALDLRQQRLATYDDGLFAGGKNTGAAVVVFPGGGYQVLAIDLEGTEVCDWLTPKGITCVLLKYRVPGLDLYPNRRRIRNRARIQNHR